MRRIVDIQVKDIDRMLAERRIHLSLNDPARDVRSRQLTYLLLLTLNP